MPRTKSGESRNKLLAIRVTEELWETLDRAWHSVCAGGKRTTKEEFLSGLLKSGLKTHESDRMEV
ncbi:hypothetical protein JXM67_15325 [candidate division WOR-3 bacterium]|nr:hypothetical protein [candidate division WOR-3 bacterium]